MIGEVESLTDDSGDAVEDGELTEEKDIRPDWLIEEEGDGWEDSVFEFVSVTVVDAEVDTDTDDKGELVTEGLEDGDFDVCTDCVLVIVSIIDWEIKPEGVSELDTLDEDESDEKGVPEVEAQADAVNDIKDVPEFDSMAVDESLWIVDGDIEGITLPENESLNEALLLNDISEDCVEVTWAEKLNVEIVVEDIDTAAVIESLEKGDDEDDSSMLPDGDPLNIGLLLNVESGVCVLVVSGEILIDVSEVKELDTTAEGESDDNDEGEDDMSALFDGESLNEELPLIDASDDCVIEE